MASMNDIKRRRASVTSTGQITKAMKLVSTVRLQKAKKNAEDSKEYFEGMYNTVSSLLSKCSEIKHPFVTGNDSPKTLVLLLSSNRGLAGGYNGNIIKEVKKQNFSTENVSFATIGLKGKEQITNLGYEVKLDYGEVGESPEYNSAVQITKELITLFNQGEIGEIYIAYTFFKNTVVHMPVVKKLLPIAKPEEDEKSNDNTLMNFEQEESEALELLIPKYITSMIYGAMLQSVASENGARMQAMDSATTNAEEMISKLTLMYNRARQGSITQELTEIIAGADAIS